VKNIIRFFVFAAVLFLSAAASAQSNDYLACRCRQWGGSNISSLGVSLNTCCSLKQSGYNVSTNFSGTGSEAVQGSGASVACKTPCGTCTSPKIRNSAVSYSEDGTCCVLPTPGGAAYKWKLTRSDIYCFNGSSTVSQNGILVYSPDCNNSAVEGTACTVNGGTGYCEFSNWSGTNLNCCAQQTGGKNMQIPSVYGCGLTYTCQ